MIRLNGVVLEQGRFPDGTLLIKQNVDSANYNIDWHYENDSELITLIYLKKHLDSKNIKNISLNMPYIPNARQDRVKVDEDVFTLKYFAEIINSLNFDNVTVLDPHSSVSEALINNIIVKTPQEIVYSLFDKKHNGNYDIGGDLTLFYPDNGASKKYCDMFKLPYCYGAKNRDWETGKILGLSIIGDTNLVKDHNVLIVDDICSRGGTFFHSASALKDMGAKDIYLYISHCENSILDGDLINSGLIKKIYTTDSIFTKEHELIEIIKNV